ncbi:hypothetical protein BGX27_001770 [Mortierella sp. AM989]|nr:hypothetical protein BGX27_001770 [Mortierella sp. AM989]
MSSAGRRISEVTKGHGATCGSMFIDLNLGNLLIKKFGKQGTKFPKDIIPGLVDKFAYELKPIFDGDEDLNLALLRNDCFDNLENPGSIGINGNGSYMRLKASELKKVVFDPVVKKVLALIQEQLDSAKSCQAIFMVGGFGASAYLLKCVKQEFGGVVRIISSPHKPEMAVVCGAVYAGLNPELVTARVTRRCYGIGVMSPFNEGIDPISLKVHTTDGAKCRTRFSTFVRKGQKVEMDECVSHRYNVINDPCTFGSYGLTIYSIDGEPRRYYTDPGVSMLARIPFPSPFKSSDPVGHKVYINVKMYFGLSEIRAEGIIQGNKYCTTLRFD